MYFQKRINIYPTDMSEWLSLVSDAQTKEEIYLCEDLESYLVFLLMRFSDNPTIFSKVMCLELLEVNYSGKKIVENNLQEIGDVCLIFVGLYPELAKSRNVDNGYYTAIGKTAYGTLSNHKTISNRDVYKLLHQQFTPITSILQAMRDIGNE
ncbi:MAG: hypothetical protein HRT87_10330 [Legionellales bacterium]|nr:hypothetical protein [Legionellales bacterium]